MARVVFFSIPAHGHTNPTLPLVAELVQRGEEVIYFSSDEFKEKVLDTGAAYLQYNFTGHDYDSYEAGKDLTSLYYLMIKITADQIEALMDLIRELKPDYIIHDAICAWGRYIAAVCHIPSISSVSTFALVEKRISLKNIVHFFKTSGLQGMKYILMARKIQRALFLKYGVPPRSFVETMMNEEALNIVYTSELFQPNADLFDKRKYAFIGPSISDRKNDMDTTDYAALPHPLVYLSMGTIWKGGFDQDALIKSFISHGYSLVMAGTHPDLEADFGSHVIVKQHVNQIEVLKHCDVFITHGGMNSVNEALYWGVPLCIHPFQTEQSIVADRVVEVGCGVRIQSLRTETLLKSISTLLDENQYRKNCEKLGESFRRSGGVKAGVDSILAYISQSESSTT